MSEKTEPDSVDAGASSPTPQAKDDDRFEKWLVILIAAAVLVYAGYGKELKQWWNKQDPAELGAMIVRQSVKSPSSFSLVDSAVQWEGKFKDKDREVPAYVVQVHFDAQNSFGALNRGCALVAFILVDGKPRWDGRNGLNDGCENAEAMGGKDGLIEMLKLLNFGDQASD